MINLAFLWNAVAQQLLRTTHSQEKKQVSSEENWENHAGVSKFFLSFQYLLQASG